MNIELKPCPFCGGEAEMMGDQYPYVECQECAGGFTANHSYDADEGDAANKWNARSAAGDSARAQGGQGAEPVAVVELSDYIHLGGSEASQLKSLKETSEGSLQNLPVGTELFTKPQPAVPEESRPLQVNRYGVDRDYFTKKLEIIIRDMHNYTPSELARSLGRLAITANSETMREPEFNIGDLIDQPKYRDSTPTTPQADGCNSGQSCEHCEPGHGCNPAGQEGEGDE